MNKPMQNYGSISSPSDVRFVASRSTEFNTICDNVVTNIFTINTSYKSLDSAFKSLGTNKDNHGLRNKIHVIQLSTNEVAAITSREIGKLKTIMLKGDKQQELQVEKLEENFMEAINRYTTTQKAIVQKQKAHLLVSVSIENEDPSEQSTDIAERQKLLAREMAFEQEMLIERESRIRKIESDVLDVNEIMRELGVLVQEQGGTLDKIENATDNALGNVEEGAAQLAKAMEHQKKRRWKLFYLVLIITIITVCVIAIILLSSSK